MITFFIIFLQLHWVSDWADWALQTQTSHLINVTCASNFQYMQLCIYCVSWHHMALYCICTHVVSPLDVTTLSTFTSFLQMCRKCSEVRLLSITHWLFLFSQLITGGGSIQIICFCKRINNTTYKYLKSCIQHCHLSPSAEQTCTWISKLKY